MEGWIVNEQTTCVVVSSQLFTVYRMSNRSLVELRTAILVHWKFQPGDQQVTNLKHYPLWNQLTTTFGH